MFSTKFYYCPSNSKKVNKHIQFQHKLLLSIFIGGLLNFPRSLNFWTLLMSIECSRRALALSTLYSILSLKSITVSLLSAADTHNTSQAHSLTLGLGNERKALWRHRPPSWITCQAKVQIIGASWLSRHTWESVWRHLTSHRGRIPPFFVKITGVKVV